MVAAEEVGIVAERVERIIEFITLMILKEKLHFRSFVGPPPPEKFQCISFLVALLNGSLLLLSPFRYDEEGTPSSQSSDGRQDHLEPTSLCSPAVLLVGGRCVATIIYGQIIMTLFVLHELHRVPFQTTVGKGYPRSFVVLHSCSNVRPPPTTTVHWDDPVLLYGLFH